MKNLVSEKEWQNIEDALMKAQVPYRVSFDNHFTEGSTTIYYDKYIEVEPFVISIKREVV